MSEDGWMGYRSIAPEDRGEDGWKGIHIEPAECEGCGQSALKAFPPREAPRFGESYVCAHCVEERKAA